jgi:RHS repeat-associated protein
MAADPQTGTGTTGYAYDAADRLTAIDPAGTASDATFGFDALGRHASRTIAGVSESDEFLGQGEAVTRIGAASPILGLVAADGARLATRTGSGVAWLVPDPHGTTAVLAADTGIASALRYDGYGQTIATAPQSRPPGADRWTYQGRLDIAPPGLDPDTPLLDFSARFYAPALGAFTQADTLAGSATDPRSLNRYLYALANPTSLIDPDGHTAYNLDRGSDSPGLWYDREKAYAYRALRRTMETRANDRDFGRGGSRRERDTKHYVSATARQARATLFKGYTAAAGEAERVLDSHQYQATTTVAPSPCLRPSSAGA